MDILASSIPQIDLRIKNPLFSKDPIKADKEFWFDTGLVNYDFSPDVKLNPIKKVFSKLMYFVLKRVIK